MLDDDIRIRIPSYLKDEFKKARPHGKMTDLLTGVVIAALEGANLPKLVKKGPMEPHSKQGVRTKYYEERLQKADSYIRFLIDSETKEKFKLFCHLKGTTMSKYLREAVEDILQEETLVPTPTKVREFAPVARTQGSNAVDIRQLWNQAFQVAS